MTRRLLLSECVASACLVPSSVPGGLGQEDRGHIPVRVLWVTVEVNWFFQKEKGKERNEIRKALKQSGSWDTRLLGLCPQVPLSGLRVPGKSIWLAPGLSSIAQVKSEQTDGNARAASVC